MNIHEKENKEFLDKMAVTESNIRIVMYSVMALVIALAIILS